MVNSMTAYGASAGAQDGWNWEWELRCVNGRGLDVKLRLPERFAGLEADLRKAVASRLSRGSLTATLRLSRDGGETGALDEAVLAAHLARLRMLHAAADASGTPLAPVSAGEILALPGIAENGTDQADALVAASGAVAAGLVDALDALCAMRAREGAALAEVLGGLVDRIETGCTAAEALAPERAAHQQRALRDALARLEGDAANLDPDRIAQEIALIAVKGDVAEELARLRIHIAAARTLLEAGGPVGRKLDFLTQEFNREANTLCSKAQYGRLTQIGLDLKAVIDQMREQVQNVE